MMKRYLLFMIACVCAVTGAWADSTVDIRTSNGTTTIVITGDGNGNIEFIDGCENLPATAEINTVVSGPLTSAVWTKIIQEKGGWNTQQSSGQILDLRGVTGLTTSELLNVGMFSGLNGTNSTNYIILPIGSSVPTASQTAANTSPSFDNWDALQYFIIPQTDGSCKVVLVDAISEININHLVLNNSSTVDVVGITDDDQQPPTEQNIKNVIAQLEAEGYKTPPVTVSGCAVSVNIDNAGSKDMTTLLAEAKAAVVAGGQNGICSLVVTGTMNNLNLAALADASMTGATRIDLSGATLASGVTIENIRIPNTLTSLILPKGMTVSEGLATKLASYINLYFAYSPSTGVEDENGHPIVADYVWVNKSGGLKEALTKEGSLRSSKYIKVASDVELKTDDIDFSSENVGEMTNLIYLDLRYANMTYDDAVIGYKSPSSQSYRLILPDDWTAEQMGNMQSGPLNAIAWSMAAIYSYSGTTLNIYELTDLRYMPTALVNSRIVYPGTTTINVVNNIGMNTDTGVSKSNLLEALNQASSDIKTIKIAGSNYDLLTFTNPYITTLDVSGLNNPSVALNVDGCTHLQTLNLTNTNLGSVHASVVANSAIDPAATGLTSVNLTGATINGTTDFLNSPLTAFTTTSGTWFKGDLNLTNTALTAFAPSAKVTGNIYLNATTTLQSIDVTSIVFDNDGSKIHIDKSPTEAEGNTDALDALHRTVGDPATAVPTISVPNGFALNRIHPNAEVVNNISEAAASGSTSGIAGCENNVCTIEYKADSKTAIVHAPHAGHFAALMSENSNYTKYPEGTTFKFDSETNINLADLQALAGYINGNDYSWRSNYYYVDLFDLKATSDLCETPSTEYPNAKGVIYQAIEWLRTNDRQFKGLILPENHTIYGSGTTLIQDANGAEPPLATCSEFIAYYKSKENATTDATKKMTVAHIYNQTNTNAEAYQASFDKMSSLLHQHNDVTGKEGGSGTDVFLISSNSASKINISSIVAEASSIEVINNEMVTSHDAVASIYAYPKKAGDFTGAVNASGLYNTPAELLKIEGPISDGIASALNQFTNGPRVLDLRDIAKAQATDEFISTLLAALTNSHIEYIILPEGMSKNTVCGTDYSSLMTSLKAVISSSNTELVAYIKQAGSLAEARYLATGGAKSASTGFITPATTGLTSVTLSGNLDAGDILANTTSRFVDEFGHWKESSGNERSAALNQEQGTITKIDLKDAVFGSMSGETRINQTDMNFSYAGLSSIRDITLPTDKTMTLIPADCFNGIVSFDDLCIPYNYKHIDNGALYGTYVSHITTTDSNGSLVDNGPRTYTLSKNLEEIGSKPADADANGVYSLSMTVFPQNRGVTDVYVLAHKVPKCYANAFPANMLYGWGGFKGGDFPYCREKYDNSTDGSMMFTVLHFPDKASFEAVTDTKMKEDNYELMKQRYTDVNKNYSMKDQTGAVDSNGDAIAWPTFSELRRAYNQATDGLTWNDWVETYDTNHEVNGGDNIPTEATNISAGSHDGDYPFAYYEGWHQFTLSMATYVAPDEKIVEDGVVTREYVEVDEWFTFCIPFSITVEQIKRILGVPASTDKVINKVYATDGTTLKEERSEGHNPEVRTLNGVTRQPGNTNKVTFLFTQPLVQDNKNDYEYWNINDETPQSSGKEDCGETEKNVPIAIQGGRPYIIKPYKLKGETITNLGKYVMERFRKEFTEDQSCGNLGKDFYEQLGNDDKLTSRFVKPYEKHKIQATALSQDGNEAEYAYHDDEKTVKYYYTFIGQFWNQRLPRYSFYVVNGKWYRLSSQKEYNWAPYKCIIMASQEVTDDLNDRWSGSGKYRSAVRSNIPIVTEVLSTGDEVFNGTFQLGFLDGLDDDDFVKTSGSRHIFSLDGDIIEYDEEGNEVTGITRLDGEDVTPTSADMKVYNLEGQFMGSSLESLSKGMYIVNGKKIVVK